MTPPGTHFTANRQELADLLGMPDATWRQCIDKVRALVGRPPACEHDWMERGTTDDRWWQCFLCGHIED